jgi:acetylxylan esterase
MIRTELFRWNQRRRVTMLLATALGLLAAVPAQAATLQQVSNWNGGMSFPADVSMYAYVPDTLASNPPLVTIIHYCGGSAQAVFGQASGIISAADQYGFIAVLPSNANASGSNGRCWDVTSTKAHTRNGGGDSHAIIQMVKYALTQYKANADRVYSTGDSSGAMMTELLLALYPDVYKAGCRVRRGAGWMLERIRRLGPVRPASSNRAAMGRSGAPDGFRIFRTSPARAALPRRCRWDHHLQEPGRSHQGMDERSRLPTTPTSTASGLTLGTHQASRQSWANSCGYVVLDALTSIGGDHGPSDALFQSNFVLPFLGLDSQTAVNAAVDP